MNSHVTRRSLLTMAASTACAVPATRLLAATGPVPVTHPAIFPAPPTPEAAIKLLTDGNVRYVEQQLTFFKADLAELRHVSEPHQSPFAAILTCADSRVPPEIIFDQSLGCLFVVRVAGNIASPDTIASLEYAGAVLNVKTLLVMGHTECGAVKATIARKPVPGEISSLFQYIRPAVAMNQDVNEGSRNNAILQAASLRDASPVLNDLIQSGKLSIRASIYDVGSGKVTLLD